MKSTPCVNKYPHLYTRKTELLRNIFTIEVVIFPNDISISNELISTLADDGINIKLVGFDLFY